LETTIARPTDAPFRDDAAAPPRASISLNVVYLARLRDAFGRAGESLVLPAPARAADVVATLRQRGGVFASELAPGRAVRVAVNHAMAREDAVLHDGDEVALLPPVTGG
jgi:molybdopterin synthase sulfur carrier subunit